MIMTAYCAMNYVFFCSSYKYLNNLFTSKVDSPYKSPYFFFVILYPESSPLSPFVTSLSSFSFSFSSSWTWTFYPPICHCISIGRMVVRAVCYYLCSMMLAVILGIILVVTIRPGDRARETTGDASSHDDQTELHGDTGDTFLDLIR